MAVSGVGLYKRFLVGLFSIWILFSPHTAFSEQTLILAAPAEIPPYYTVNDEGIIPDIMRAALGPKGYKIKVKAMGNIRIAKSLSAGSVDIAPFAVQAIPNTFNSVNYLTFLNVAVTKKTRNLKIGSISDLKGLKVAAFQGATNVFGTDYKDVVENKATLYKEISNQKNQMKVFWHNRVDTVILGKLIFDYRSFYVEGATNSPDDVAYHYIFGEGTKFPAVFADEKVRDDFNAGYNDLITTKKLASIYEHYQK
jgi:polar amino acid transport system substrate-binding protein